MAVEYDGTEFYGWQVQRQSPTVQACVEQALSRVADEPVAVICAGRTDTGVHALGQIIHFDVRVTRSARSWLLGGNTYLPAAAALRWCGFPGDDFDARRSAVARTYSYRIHNHWLRPALDRRRVAWVRTRLDAAAMHEAAQPLIGEHDFSAFRAAGCQSRHARRNVHAIAVLRRGDFVTVTVTANAFLYHMVRNIVGALLAVGRGDRPVDWPADVLRRGDRKLAGVTAPAEGLVLEAVRYPAECGVPEPPWPAFPSGQGD